MSIAGSDCVTIVGSSYSGRIFPEILAHPEDGPVEVLLEERFMKRPPGQSGADAGYEVAGAHGGSFERDNAASLKDAGQELASASVAGRARTLPPQLERLVGGEDHTKRRRRWRSSTTWKRTVGGVGAVGEISDLVHDEELRADIG